MARCGSGRFLGGGGDRGRCPEAAWSCFRRPLSGSAPCGLLVGRWPWARPPAARSGLAHRRGDLGPLVAWTPWVSVGSRAANDPEVNVTEFLDRLLSDVRERLAASHAAV